MNKQATERLKAKTPEQQFLRILEQEFHGRAKPRPKGRGLGRGVQGMRVNLRGDQAKHLRF